ncbi:uncharacterized protein LOC135333633 [Halichondria panicea]|uniref:uncharacterized protein LOC135333633 n=1 Tax=Halichondria panicea TaxID=6063 RepID=UPI00312B8286
MSDSEQPTATEQPEEQPVADTQAPETEEQPTGTGEDTAETPAEQPQPDEPIVADEGEPGPSDEEPKPAEEGVEEPKPAEEGVEDQAAPAVEETEQPEAEAEPEPEVKEEPVVITPEGSPFWLSTEDVLAKGLLENEVENFKNFFFRQSHSLQAWYDQLKDLAIQTEFITLSKEEIEALSAVGDPSEEQQQVLSGLEDRVNQAIELFEGDGAVVRVNERSAKDSVYDRDDETYIAQVRDAVVNELEVEKQRANAYAIWKEQEKGPNAFKRGINTLRASLRRPRAHSTGRKEAKPKLEEEKNKDEEKQEEPPKDETAEVAEGGEEEATGGKVTIEVQVENDGEDKPADETPVAEEAPKDEGEAAEAPKDEGEPAEAPKEETEVVEAPKEEVEPAPKEGEEAAKDDGEAAAKEGDKTKEGDIEKVDEEAQPEEPKKSPTHVHHKLRKAKTESLDNQILRAFLLSTTALFKVKTGKEAIDLLRRSVSIRNDLNQLKAFGGVEGVQVSLSVCRWQEQVASYPGMEFRGFVYKNELNALSQYNDTAYYPNTDTYFNTIQAKVQDFFKANIQESLRELENYIIDFYVTPDKVLVIRLNPFYTAIGACLYTWNENGKVLTQGPFEFRIVDAPRTAPEAFSSFQPFWQTMLQSVLDQRRPPGRQRGCILL